MTQAEKIKQYLLKEIPNYPHSIVGKTMSHFGVSRTTVARHIQHLVKSGEVFKTGSRNKIAYSLASSLKQACQFSLNKKFDEASAFHESISSSLKAHVNKAAWDICEYGVTEMLNNCKDHSQGQYASLTMDIERNCVKIICEDDGIGIFEQLKQSLGFKDVRDIMFELSKGKLTSDSEHHSGEGLFFSARAFDRFSITANGYCFLRDNIEHDWAFFGVEKSKGTKIEMEIQRKTARNLINIFERYQDNDSLAFTKTEVIIEMAKDYGDRLIARSQAKRVTRNLEKFSHVTLDFRNVEAVGQGFVDQVFRVYLNQNPNIEIDFINASSDVAFMIKRGVASK